MEPQETGRRYDVIAPLWDATRRETRNGVNFLERAINLCQSRHTALDVGCGSGGHMMHTMIGAGFHVTGLDVSAKLLAMAKARHPSATFLHEEITEWVPSLRYDLIVAWDSIFHLPHRAHVPVMEKLCGCLSEHGVFLFTAGGIDSEIVGTMHECEFGYSSLSDLSLMSLLYRGGCTPLLLERDQFPLHHVVIIAAKGTSDAAL